MKHKYYVAICVLLCACIAYAGDFALDKGSVIYNGTLSMSSLGGKLYEDAGGNRVLHIEATPFIGKFIYPGLAVGGKLSSAYISQNAPYDYYESEWGFGPSMYFYLIHLNNDSSTLLSKMYPYITATYQYGAYTVKMRDKTVEDKTWGGKLAVGLGATMILGNSAGLSLEYSYDISEIGYSQIESSNILVGFSVFNY